MNRSFHAFAVLLVSLAGGMIAATWTTMLTVHPKGTPLAAKAQDLSTPHFCSCNPEDRDRFEKGCARDKTTGELYGCGLGLGNNGITGKSVLGDAADTSIASVSQAAAAIHQGIASIPWQEIGVQARRWEQSLAAMERMAQERDYAAAELAAAELAAAGVDSTKPRLELDKSIAELRGLLTAEMVTQTTKGAIAFVARTGQHWERESRLWLVERGLHRAWDDAEESLLKEEQLAAARLQFEDADFERWFENFPPPITRPNRLINPIEPRDESEESRRIILATAKALEALSGLLHQTAENLARHAEQDVAELHKLKSGIEERR